MEMNSAGDDGSGQTGARHLPNDRTEHRHMMGHEDPKNTYSIRHKTLKNVPQEAFAHRQARGTIPDMRPERDTNSQQFRDMASLVSQLAAEVLQLKSNHTPPATTADADSISPLTARAVNRLPDVVAVPLPPTPAVPTGEPVHCDSGARPKRQHSVKLKNYAGQGASFEAFLAKYEDHSRYYNYTNGTMMT